MAGVKGMNRKPHVLPTLDEVTATVSTPTDKELPTLAPEGAGRHVQERSALQLQVDDWAKEQYAAYEAAGKPAGFTSVKAAIRKVRVAPEQEKGMRLVIRKAGEFHGYGVAFGRAGVTDQGGRVVIAWRMQDKRERKTDEANSES